MVITDVPVPTKNTALLLFVQVLPLLVKLPAIYKSPAPLFSIIPQVLFTVTLPGTPLPPPRVTVPDCTVTFAGTPAVAATEVDAPPVHS